MEFGTAPGTVAAIMATGKLCTSYRHHFQYRHRPGCGHQPNEVSSLHKTSDPSPRAGQQSSRSAYDNWRMRACGTGGPSTDAVTPDTPTLLNWEIPASTSCRVRTPRSTIVKFAFGDVYGSVGDVKME